MADLGENDALRVMESIGGATWEIPLEGRVNLCSRLLVELVGARLADVLTTHYGGSRVYIPSARSAGKADRNARIAERFCAELALGKGAVYAAAVVALEFDMTSSAIRGIIRQRKGEVRHGRA
ncbi:Mor transcription activator family protein [Aeromonas veronii]|uniref:Mor transcription activator family protein n=1 Tax=Aeromonas veronii TaxID=654 RepID=UPI00330EB772|nr:hypothetical protein [Aeromonas veronii]